MAVDWWRTPERRRSSRSLICLASQPAAMSRSDCIRSLPRATAEPSEQYPQRVSARRRVERISGRRAARSGFSDQCGQSAISERRDRTAASRERMVCHLEAKQVTEAAAGRSRSRHWAASPRTAAGRGGGAAGERIFPFSSSTAC
ncbi:holo-[acyl-carrier-protein] synthase [Striga asiatica]|uniref:Holo-[acyl-carrier-protein] synthase n=1 Tax=Striga asiatica TaxID=4170 RepID=A0A5A7PFL4_STRAF|nr:holo-[acyl-carrier-protein] synthase [Striga asiatica]